MEYGKIQTALTDHLRTLPDLPQLFEENDEGFLQSAEQVSTRTSSYIRTVMQPLRSFTGSIGVGGDDVYPVIFLVQHFIPKGEGVQFSNTLADDVIKLFARGRRLVLDDVCVDTTRAYKNPNQFNDNYTMSTIAIEAESFITRP